MGKRKTLPQIQQKLENLRSAEAEAIKSSIAKDVREEIKRWVWRPIAALLVIGGFFGITSYTGIKAIQNRILKQATKDFEKTVQELYSAQNVSNLVDRFIRMDAEKIIETQVVAFAEPRLRAHTERIERDDIKPLQTKAEDLNSRFSELSSNVTSASSSFVKLDSQFDELSVDILALRQFFNARRGDRVSYLGLIESARGDVASLAGTLRQDIDEFYRDFKNETIGKPAGRWGREVTHIKTGNYYQAAAENVYALLTHKDSYQRQAEVAEPARRGLKYFVEDLVSVVTNDSNVLVASRAVSSIESLTGKSFGCLPPFCDVTEWWEKEGRTNTLYTSPFPLLSQARQFMREGKYDEALAIYEQETASRSGFANSRYYMGLLYQAKGNAVAAREAFKKATEEDQALYQATFEYATYLIQEGKTPEAIGELRRAKQYFTGNFAKKIREQSDFQSLLGNSEFEELCKAEQ